MEKLLGKMWIFQKALVPSSKLSDFCHRSAPSETCLIWRHCGGALGETRFVLPYPLLVSTRMIRKRWGKYSLGMKQRLGLAQAIMEDPDILLLDEPMNGLDNSGVSEMRNYLLQLREKGKTILLISHSIEDINTLCDTVHEMDHGVLTEKEHISSECLDHNLKN